MKLTNHHLLVLALLILVSSLSGIAAADKVLIRQWESGPNGEDSFVYDRFPDTEYGYGSALWVGDIDLEDTAHPGNDPFMTRIWLKFPLDRVPQGSEIHAAYLGLHTVGTWTPQGPPHVRSLYSTSNAWHDTLSGQEITWRNQPSRSSSHSDEVTVANICTDYCWDVQTWVSQARNASDEISLVMELKEEGQLGYTACFFSKNDRRVSIDYYPWLEVVFTPPADDPDEDDNPPDFDLPGRRNFQDNFPSVQTLDLENLGQNCVRVDIGANIDYATSHYVLPGDSLVIRIESALELKGTKQLIEPPLMHYILDPNPIFDPHRTSGVPDAGFLVGDSVRTAAGETIPGSWFFDLPDTGFFYPGDVLHYCFEATTADGGEPWTGRCPPDTTGFALFPSLSEPHPSPYPDRYTVRALPSLRWDDVLEEYVQPPILLWIDAREYDAVTRWQQSLANLGYVPGHDYDLYCTNEPIRGDGNGLGNRATVDHLSGYETILYTSGGMETPTLGHGDPDHDPSDDLGILDSWLRLGDKNLLLTGDHLAWDLDSHGGDAAQFLADWVGVEVLDRDFVSLLGGDDPPLVEPVPDKGIFTEADQWRVGNFCLKCFWTFNACQVEVGTVDVAGFPALGGGSKQSTYTAGTLRSDPVYLDEVVFLPYRFSSIQTVETGGRAATPSAARTKVLEDILNHFGHSGTGPVTGFPDPCRGSLRVTAHPNPFNPLTRIEYRLPRPGPLSVRIYDLRGRQVRSLLETPRAEVQGTLVWDGRDDGAAAVASGVYFYRLVGEEDVREVGKITLVR